MNLKKALGIMLGVVFALAMVTPAARASMRNQAEKITFNQPVQVPGVVLPAGTYWFEVTGLHTGTPDIVTIYNSNWSKVYATVSTVPVERKSWTGRASWDSQGRVVLAEGPAGQPDSVVEWFYPSRITGHQFLYPKHQERQLQQEAKLKLDITPAA
jgi:hypothetical protein